MNADRYARTVAFLKIALPLLALALLSTLFLVSRAVTPPANIPFAPDEVRERLTSQQLTEPFFAGTSARGDRIAFTAERLTRPGGKVGTNQAESIFVTVDFANGAQVTVEADLAVIDIAADRGELSGAVEFITSMGFELRSERLDVKLSDIDITSPGPVDGNTPAGDLEAGRMHLFVAKDGSDAQLIFTNGVKLLYRPKELKD
jgi:lipopolysaccharide export system protein LptC